jgi:hypothetical protein
MATYLATPTTTGGIYLVLQQLASNHPYHLGNDAVVAYPPTLRAIILEAWNIVSCGFPKPSIFDKFPFIRSQDITDPDLHYLAQERSFAIIKVKRPKVVGCMGKRTSQDDVVGSMRAVEGIGVGRTFVRREIELEANSHTHLVTAFHLSYAVNYNLT